MAARLDAATPGAADHQKGEISITQTTHTGQLVNGRVAGLAVIHI